MAAIYNLEFTRIDNEVSLYINGRLRASNFAYDNPKMNVKYQFYVEKLHPVDLTIVFYYGQRKPQPSEKHWQKARISFTLHKSGSKRPLAMVHEFWDLSQSAVREFSYRLTGDAL